MSPSIACVVGERRGIAVVEEALHLRGVDQQRAEAARRELVRDQPKLAGGHATREHLLDEAPRAENDFMEVELGQFGKIAELALDDAREPQHLLAAHAAYIRRVTAISSASAEPSWLRTYASASASAGTTSRAHHLAEERFLGIEIEVERCPC